MDDIETGDYNNDTNINDLKNINLKKTSGTQQLAKKNHQKYRNLSRKKPYSRSNMETLEGRSLSQKGTCQSKR